MLMRLGALRYLRERGVQIYGHFASHEQAMDFLKQMVSVSGPERFEEHSTLGHRSKSRSAIPTSICEVSPDCLCCETERSVKLCELQGDNAAVP